MKLRFVWVGKTKQPAIKDLVENYLERIGRFAGVEVSELKDRTDKGSDPRTIIEREGSDIIERVRAGSFLVALDERGRQIDSQKLAEVIERHQISGEGRQMTFVIGGHNGLSEAVRQRADMVLALSRMTLTHEIARVVLLEQVYRAFTIIHDLPYQK